jgi:hypothetical protein
MKVWVRFARRWNSVMRERTFIQGYSWNLRKKDQNCAKMWTSSVSSPVGVEDVVFDGAAVAVSDTAAVSSMETKATARSASGSVIAPYVSSI